MNPRPHVYERLERQSLWRVFREPVLLGVSSIVGLISALLGDGVWGSAPRKKCLFGITELFT
jgi:hypothetical protein